MDQSNNRIEKGLVLNHSCALDSVLKSSLSVGTLQIVFSNLGGLAPKQVSTGRLHESCGVQSLNSFAALSGVGFAARLERAKERLRREFMCSWKLEYLSARGANSQAR